jgi:hypothetical protein
MTSNLFANPDQILSSTSVELAPEPAYEFIPYKKEAREQFNNKPTGEVLSNEGKWTFTGKDGKSKQLWGTDFTKPFGYAKEIGVNKIESLDLIKERDRYFISINGITRIPSNFPKEEWRGKPVQSWDDHEVASLGFRLLVKKLATMAQQGAQSKQIDNDCSTNITEEMVLDAAIRCETQNADALCDLIEKENPDIDFGENWREDVKKIILPSLTKK